MLKEFLKELCSVKIDAMGDITVFNMNSIIVFLKRFSSLQNLWIYKPVKNSASHGGSQPSKAASHVLRQMSL